MSTTTAPPPARRRHAARGRLTAWLFIAPLLIVNVLVIAGPGLMSVYYSFTDWDGLDQADFIWFSNYAELFGDPDFRRALLHNLLWTAFFLIVPMSMGLLGAFLLSRIRRGQLAFRVLFFIPYVIATVVSATIWRQILSPTSGVGPALSDLGIPLLDDVNFLGDGDIALGAVAFINNWQWWGFLVVIFLAAMQGIEPSLYEAARMDGASTWREFWHITLPSIRPTFMFLSLMTVIWSFLVFDYVYILTQGGPAGSTDVLSTVMYRAAFEEQQAGYASAIGVILALISATTVCGYLYLRRRLRWDI
ncbi:raffinose/stachyose/melibiose transport system permease protein [Sinosporangium album]|uniref:Raffinose/stachyose/melibiose transport system permease protein n=1 Tax=Sinosporangium album TaxID=504805 RepID=A0A1G8B7Q2_9ACTN|nr:sugar ABC transporter permease [Sinosporangium album]SDH28660.1 raffinose/stachyose/melibiose transport system permease protein [Sinosporangium album]